ncbi:aldo/keto reductase [Enterococcus sp. HY326]|uniref:aldo/keto reductase n=1 Tax=Enterococcus sp. HY326 TaxID=2971265 RepID=UPI0022402793|nr:aldo/keto reductase [Enterococcus sp. HY326]
MEYTKLGNTGLDVSKICLGAMSFGDPVNWFHKWVLEEDASRPIIKGALDLGINFFDTANVYSIGRSEEILGAALKDYADRDKIVLATKVHQKMFDGPNGGGLSRKHIMSQIDQSLKRLQTDYVDLYIIHRWDYTTPIEETMEALHDVVKAGKARYIGASAMHAFQFQAANNVAEKNGWTQFVSMQNHLNLIYREEEREMIPYCESKGIALTPYSPLASGRLARNNNESSKRLETDDTARSKYDKTAEQDQLIIDRVGELAERYGVSRVEISLSWLFSKPTLAAPVIGATKLSHVETAVKAVDMKLTPADIAYLEEPYLPHSIVGFN